PPCLTCRALSSLLAGTLPVFVSSLGDHRDLHSFPTDALPILDASADLGVIDDGGHRVGGDHQPEPGGGMRPVRFGDGPGLLPARSEEHTSELQSRENLVCRLLLENKNTGSGRQYWTAEAVVGW